MLLSRHKYKTPEEMEDGFYETSELIQDVMIYTSNGDLGSMAFFAIDHIRAYYLFGANDPGIRDQHTGTAVIWDAFRFLNATGVKEVDLEVVNSPNRGWFKLSFGGELVPYYNLKWTNNNISGQYN